MPPFSTEKRGTGCSLLEGCVQWPADAAARYRAKGYWKGETLGAHLRRWAAERPDSAAVIAGEEQLTYGDLDRHADSLAMHLGDRKSTRLNSSHGYISYAVFCLKKKKERA